MITFRIEGSDLVVASPEGGASRSIGTYMPDNQEQMLRLMYRVFNEGRAAKASEIRAAISSS